MSTQAEAPMAYRDAINAAMDEALEADPSVLLMGEDVANEGGVFKTNAGLPEKYGERITFWGGGADTQHTLPHGTPDDVRRQDRERLEIFAPGGGFVFHTVHNIQADVPTENLLAMFEAIREFSL